MNKRTKSLYGYIFPAVGGLFMTSCVLTVLVSVILMIVGMVFSEHMALNLIYTAFLFSTKRTAQADAIALSRGSIVKAIAIFGIPLLLGDSAVWLAPFLAEAITLIFAAALTKTTKLVYK